MATITRRAAAAASLAALTITAAACGSSSSSPPTYSQVVASYPRSITTCNVVADLIGDNHWYIHEGSTMVVGDNGQLTPLCYGTKITVKTAASINGQKYAAGTMLTLDGNGKLVQVTSWR